MFAPSFRTLLLSLVLLGPAAAARALIPNPEPPVPQRVALADAVVVGKVASIEDEPLQASPLLKIRGGSRVSFKMAQVTIDRVLLGRAGSEHVRVGVGPGQSMPVLSVGQTGCFFLRRHPEDFFVLTAGSDVIDSRRKEYSEALVLTGRCANLLANPDEGLRSPDGADRLLTAAMLIFRFRTARYAYSGTPRTEPVDGELSRRILTVLGEGSFSEEAAWGPTGRLKLFLRLDLTEDDGWAPPRRLPEVAASAEKWLADHRETYRIRRYIPEERIPVETDQGGSSTENQTGGGGDGHGPKTALHQRHWLWLCGVLACVLAVAGYAIYQRRRLARVQSVTDNLRANASSARRE
jgi:hypothetical protein